MGSLSPAPPPGVSPLVRRPPIWVAALQTLGQSLLGGAVLLGIGVGVGFWVSPPTLVNQVKSWITPVTSAPQVDLPSLIVQQLRGASDLTTAIFAMEAVVPGHSDRTLAGYVIGSTKLLYIAYGEVRAGVDLSQITATNVQLGEEGAIHLTLPPPQILDRKLDLNRSRVYDYDRGFLGLGPDQAPELQQQAQRQALATIVAAACNQGLLLEANRRAQGTVEQLLATAGFKSVTVTTVAPDQSTCATPPNSDTVIPGQP
ncbi:MAG: DUF4230 domain-containing protein [Nodosilinea sp.]